MTTIERYDADQVPGAPWLALPVAERIDAVVAYHRGLGGRHAGYGDLALHARLHVTVEDQLGADVAAVRDLFARFSESGIVRHEIVHAASATFVESMRAAVDEGVADGAGLYASRLASLQPSEWLARAVPARLGPGRPPEHG